MFILACMESKAFCLNSKESGSLSVRVNIGVAHVSNSYPLKFSELLCSKP